MKQNLQITLTVLAGVSLAGLLAGCPMPTKDGIARNTTEYNLVAEKAGNEMLLLNIVRASKHRPMYFTSFGKLTGQMSFEVGTGSITIPFGKSFEDPYSIAPNASYEYSPFFDVAVLDTKEFTNGIMTPVPMKTIEYYWSQGWHPEMLLHLFIRRIDIIDPKNTKEPNDPNYMKPEKTYLNYPGDPNLFPEFQEQIRLKNWEWGIKKVDPTSIGEVEANEDSQLKNLIEAQKAGFTLTPVKDNKIKLCLNQVKYDFTRQPTPKYRETVLEKIKQEKIPDNEKELLRKMLYSYTFDDPNGSSSGNKDGKLQIKVYIRSPEAILYYLGEILRAEIQGENKGKPNPNIPIIYAGLNECEGTENWLFYAREEPHEACEETYETREENDKDLKPCVTVEYEGTKYVIPGRSDSKKGCCRDRSMHVLSLVSLLIGQQKKITETPATATVSVIGR